MISFIFAVSDIYQVLFKSIQIKEYISVCRGVIDMKQNKYFRALFPNYNRGFIGKRWTRIILRSLHLVGLIGIGGVYFSQQPNTLWLVYIYLTLGTGTLLMLIEIWTNAIWLIQLRGVVILIKLGLLAILAHTTVWQNELLICIIFISGIIAHAPANMRYFSILHGKRIDSLY